ncbi:MAG TPA: prepilin-type N-terminal cleavage/methylation domain-containing protein [Burkholderiales bacterium]|jgi:prepilin-type N-terminal cleavage/methylation domain-containing protein
MKARQTGFTLVEIAIVLVIIGLLLGGILKGQEMITQAKIKNVMADFSGISAAYHGYQDRYRRLPGDDNGAAARWTDLAAATDDGNGNGVVAGAYNGAGNIESRNFWLHLRKAGFVAGTGKDQPFNALTGMLGVQTGDAAGAAAMLDGANGFVGLIMCSANLPDKIAIAVDTQMDDGLSQKGAVRAIAQAAPNPAVDNSAAAANYAETGSNVYTICRAL